jgi:glycosyltransferase involved in cell wall biosynthesis
LRAKLFVYPSLAERGESFGLAPLEAMANGCPALVSNLRCFDDYLKKGNGFRFDHNSKPPAAALSEQLHSLTTNDNLLLSTAVRAHEVARDYDVTTIAERYLEDFVSLSNRSYKGDS